MEETQKGAKSRQFRPSAAVLRNRTTCGCEPDCGHQNLSYEMTQHELFSGFCCQIWEKRTKEIRGITDQGVEGHEQGGQREATTKTSTDLDFDFGHGGCQSACSTTKLGGRRHALSESPPRTLSLARRDLQGRKCGKQ